jgi:hypothetical protein
MTENTVSILIFVLLAAASAFLIGWVCGEQVCHRKNAEEKVAQLSEQLQQPCSRAPKQERLLKEMRSVLNDAHKHIVAVSKGLKNPVR